MADGSIIIDTKINMANLGKELKQVVAKVKDGMEQANRVATVALTGITASIVALGGATTKFAKTTDRIDKLSQKLGITRKGFQELDYVLSQNGTTIDGMQRSMRTLADDMANGGKNLAKLGIDARTANGDLKSTEQVLMESIMALQSMGESAERTALANDIFGMSATELAPLLNQSAESTQNLIDKANELGLVLSDETINAGVELTDTLDTLKRTMANLLNNAILPIVQKANEIAQSFITWATEGNKLQSIMTKVVDVFMKLLDSGAIESILVGALAIKGLATAFGILNAVMSANPISIIIIGVGALIAGIMMLYKNWETAFSYIQQVLATTVLAFVTLENAMQTGIVTALKSIQIAFIKLGQIIVDKVLGKVIEFLEVAQGLPFVGKMFDGITEKAKGVRQSFSDMTDEAIDNAEETIQASKDKMAQAIEEEKLKIAQIKEARLLRIKQLEDAKQISKAQAEAEKQAILAEEQARLDSLKVLEKEIENSQVVFTAETLGENIMKSMARGIRETASQVLLSVKSVTDGIGEVIGNAFHGDIGRNSQLVFKALGDLAEGGAKLYAGDIGGGVSSIASGIGAGLDVINGLIDGFFSAVDYLAKFSADAVINNLSETLKGLEGFFADTGELYKISSMFDQGIKLVKDFVDGLMANKDKIMTEIKNIMVNISNLFIENKDIFTDIASFVSSMAVTIIQNLPLIIKAGIEIVKAIGQGIMDNLDKLIQASFDLVIAVVGSVKDNLGQLISAGLIILLAIAKGILDNFPEIQEAIMMMIPAIVDAIVDNLPQIVEAFAELIPMLIITFITQQPRLIAIWVQMLGSLLTSVGKLIAKMPAIGVSIISGMIQGLSRGAGNLITEVTRLGNKIASLFGNMGKVASNAFLDSFKVIVEAIKRAEEAIAKITGTVSDLGGNALTSVTSTASSVGSGITGAVSGVGKLFGFASGSAYIEQDQIAQIHKGERIIPANFNDSIMSGETMMLNSKAFASIMNGLQGGVSMPSTGSFGNTVIKLVANITGIAELDGREVGRMAFQHIDEFAGASFGA